MSALRAPPPASLARRQATELASSNDVPLDHTKAQCLAFVRWSHDHTNHTGPYQIIHADGRVESYSAIQYFMGEVCKYVGHEIINIFHENINANALVKAAVLSSDRGFPKVCLQLTWSKWLSTNICAVPKIEKTDDLFFFEFKNGSVQQLRYNERRVALWKSIPFPKVSSEGDDKNRHGGIAKDVFLGAFKCQERSHGNEMVSMCTTTTSNWWRHDLQWLSESDLGTFEHAAMTIQLDVREDNSLVIRLFGVACWPLPMEFLLAFHYVRNHMSRMMTSRGVSASSREMFWNMFTSELMHDVHEFAVYTSNIAIVEISKMMDSEMESNLTSGSECSGSSSNSTAGDSTPLQRAERVLRDHMQLVYDIDNEDANKILHTAYKMRQVLTAMDIYGPIFVPGYHSNDGDAMPASWKDAKRSADISNTTAARLAVIGFGNLKAAHLLCEEHHHASSASSALCVMTWDDFAAECYAMASRMCVSKDSPAPSIFVKTEPKSRNWIMHVLSDTSAQMVTTVGLRDDFALLPAPTMILKLQQIQTTCAAEKLAADQIVKNKKLTAHLTKSLRMQQSLSEQLKASQDRQRELETQLAACEEERRVQEHEFADLKVDYGNLLSNEDVRVQKIESLALDKKSLRRQLNSAEKEIASARSQNTDLETERHKLIKKCENLVKKACLAHGGFKELLHQTEKAEETRRAAEASRQHRTVSTCTEPVVDHQNVTTCILANEIAKLESECAEVVPKPRRRRHKQQKSSQMDTKEVQQQTQQRTIATQAVFRTKAETAKDEIILDMSKKMRQMEGELAKMRQIEGELAHYRQIFGHFGHYPTGPYFPPYYNGNAVNNIGFWG